MDMEEETTATTVTFLGQKTTRRDCDLHAAFYIILYWRNENDNICFKSYFFKSLSFITYFW